MAVYKVPQDVEADDKLIGPFSFRQFIYLIIVALSAALAWGLAQVFIGLAVIPLPLIIFFGALALPIRKDQPMEIYLAAIVSFYLKPRKRLWDPDGIDTFIEITVPKTVEVHRTKDISQADAEERFSYLANLVDSQGWAIRGSNGPGGINTPLNNDYYLEAQGVQDVLDDSNMVAQSFNVMMSERSQKLKEEARQHMFQPPPAPAAPPAAPTTPTTPADNTPTPTYNPYPTEIHQSMVQPVNDVAHQYTAPTAAPTPAPAADPTPAPTTTSDKPLSADIMNLANNSDLSVETLAKEAHRLQAKENDMNEEVVISLR
ncbi:MAG TPA: PrgI family protein [Candidatus Saccharimonadaceae bacterium]|nr:PrgI family protein [Candidatus Saccharimonadaceae bacterium]